MKLDKKLQDSLKTFSGPELMEELKKIIEYIQKPDVEQNIRDRGCYLILQNIERVPEEDQERIISMMLEANPYPSRGVRGQLWHWHPSKMPAAKIVLEIINLTGIGGLRECLRNVQNKMSDSEFEEIKTKLVAKGYYEFAAWLAEFYAPHQLPQLIDQTMTQALELRKQHLLHLAISFSIRHKLIDPLVRLRNSNLIRPNNLDITELAPIADILDDLVWKEKTLQKFISSCQNWPYHPCVSWFEPWGGAFRILLKI